MVGTILAVVSVLATKLLLFVSLNNILHLGGGAKIKGYKKSLMTSAKFTPLLAALHYTFIYLYYCQADLISSRQPYRFFCPNIYLNPYYSENAQNASIVTTNNVQFSLAQKHPSYNLAASLAWETGTVMYNHGILDMRLQSIFFELFKENRLETHVYDAV